MDLNKNTVVVCCFVLALVLLTIMWIRTSSTILIGLFIIVCILAHFAIMPPRRLYMKRQAGSHKSTNYYHPHMQSTKRSRINWQTIVLWAGLLGGVAAVFVFNLNRLWLFVLVMVACHLGHGSTTRGGHH